MADEAKTPEGMNDQSFKDKVMNFLNSNPQPQEQAQSEPAQEAPATADNATQGEQPTPGNQPEGVQSAEQTPVDNNGLILGKFKSPEELASAYQNLEKFNTQTRQELSQNNKALQDLQAVVQQLQEGNPANAGTNEPANPEVDSEEFMNSFYENPQEALKSLVNSLLEQTVKPQLEPIVQKEQAAQKQAEWDNLVGQFASQHDDFGNFKGDMQTILDSHPELGDHPNGIEIIYNMAKGQNFKAPTQLMQDDNFINQVMSNPDVMNKIVTQYMQGVNKGDVAPVVISGQPNGSMQLTPENKPKSLDEARGMAMKMFGL